MSASDYEEIEPEQEPEYVGAHSGIHHASCRNIEDPEDFANMYCGAMATHTVVMYSGGKLHEIPMCDDCGEPGDAPEDREWSGNLYANLSIETPAEVDP